VAGGETAGQAMGVHGQEFRLGLYDADPENRRVKLWGPHFSSDASDQRVIGLVLAKFRRFAARYPSVTECLGVFQVSSRDEIRDTPSDVFDKTV
jgi:hypothetical protein